MALTLFTDTFVTLTDAEALIDDTTWSSSSTSQKERALKDATNALNEMTWAGYAVADDQPLSWPRTVFTFYDPVYNLDIEVAEGTVPDRLKRATANLAKHYRQYPDAVAGQSVSFDRIKLGPLELEDTNTESSASKVPYKEVTKVVGPLLRDYAGFGNFTWWRAN